MAISSSTRKAGPFIGNDATTVFPFAFKVFTAADLRVVNTSALGIESDLELDVDYTVSLNTNQDNDPGGSVTRLAALPTGERLTITSDVAALQPLVLTNNGGFYPRVINDAFDKITIIAQQLIEQVGRSLKLPISSTANATLPDPVANSLLAWNSSGNGFANVAPGTLVDVAAYSEAFIKLFDGDGVETDFELDYDPGVLANLSVSVSGVVQAGGEDFTWIGTTITFLVAPPAGTRIQVRYTRVLPPVDLAAATSAAAASAAAAAGDAVATAADRVQTGLDRVATAADRVQTGLDRVATAADRVQTGLDRTATGVSADAAAASATLAAAQTDYSLLADEAAPVGTDLLGVFRVGLKKLTLANLATFVVNTATAFVQSGTGAVSLTLQKALGLLYYTPEQFGAADAYNSAVDDTAFVQAAIDAAGNWSSVAFARRVLFSRMYKITSSLLKRPYVSIYGVGMARCGLMSFMSSGPAMDCDVVVNTSSCFLDNFSGFRIDGSNATGTAYALRVQGQKHTVLNQPAFWNWSATSVHAVQVLGACYHIKFNQPYWLNCKQALKIAATNVATGLFPTNIFFDEPFWDTSPTTASEAILIEDASGVLFRKPQAQAVDAKYLYRVVGGATKATSHVHKWDDPYVEDCGGGQVGAQTWRFEGVSTNVIEGCEINRAEIHGAAPDGGHIYATYTDRLSVTKPLVDPSHVWVVSGGNNTNNDVDARFVGACDFQNPLYNTTKVVFTDAETIVYSGGPLSPAITKQATGRYHVNFARDLKSTAAFLSVDAQDAGGEPLLASAYFVDVNTVEVRVFARDAADAVVPTPNTSGTAIPIPDLVLANATRVSLTVEGLLGPA